MVRQQRPCARLGAACGPVATSRRGYIEPASERADARPDVRTTRAPILKNRGADANAGPTTEFLDGWLALQPQLPVSSTVNWADASASFVAKDEKSRLPFCTDFVSQACLRRSPPLSRGDIRESNVMEHRISAFGPQSGAKTDIAACLGWAGPTFACNRFGLHEIMSLASEMLGPCMPSHPHLPALRRNRWPVSSPRGGVNVLTYSCCKETSGT